MCIAQRTAKLGGNGLLGKYSGAAGVIYVVIDVSDTVGQLDNAALQR